MAFKAENPVQVVTITILKRIRKAKTITYRGETIPIKYKPVKGGVGDWTKKEIHVEPGMPRRTQEAIAVHEAVERDLMLKGYSYEKAHRIAVIKEHKYLLGRKKK